MVPVQISLDVTTVCQMLGYCCNFSDVREVLHFGIISTTDIPKIRPNFLTTLKNIPGIDNLPIAYVRKHTQIAEDVSEFLSGQGKMPEIETEEYWRDA